MGSYCHLRCPALRASAPGARQWCACQGAGLVGCGVVPGKAMVCLPCTGQRRYPKGQKRVAMAACLGREVVEEGASEGGRGRGSEGGTEG